MIKRVSVTAWQCLSTNSTGTPQGIMRSCVSQQAQHTLAGLLVSMQSKGQVSRVCTCKLGNTWTRYPSLSGSEGLKVGKKDRGRLAAITARMTSTPASMHAITPQQITTAAYHCCELVAHGCTGPHLCDKRRPTHGAGPRHGHTETSEPSQQQILSKQQHLHPQACLRPASRTVTRSAHALAKSQARKPTCWSVSLQMGL